MTRARDADFQAWADAARGADCLTVLGLIRPGHGLKVGRAEAVGPCPACGGSDRFSINRRKNLWHCRVAGRGGDAIALVEYVDGADFLGAVETITGRPPPTGGSGVKADPAKIAAQEKAAAEAQAKRARDDNAFRTKEIRRAHDIWSNAGAMPGSVAEAYLRYRGVNPAPGAKLRSYLKLPYWHCVHGVWKVIHEGPAMVAAIQGPDMAFIGCHITYIDASFASAKGKAEIFDPATGEMLDAKKVRGSQKGGHIHLAGPEVMLKLKVGEGIESVYAVRESILNQDLSTTAFWSGVNLGNIGGRARESIRHPSLTRTDKNGRVSPLKVPGPVPDFADTDALRIADQVIDVMILGDGDSDRFTTDCTLRRAAARWARTGRIIRRAWADDDRDFNSMLQV